MTLYIYMYIPGGLVALQVLMPLQPAVWSGMVTDSTVLWPRLYWTYLLSKKNKTVNIMQELRG